MLCHPSSYHVVTPRTRSRSCQFRYTLASKYYVLPRVISCMKTSCSFSSMSKPFFRTLLLLSHIKKQPQFPSIVTTTPKRAFTMSVRRNTVLATISVLLLGYLLRQYGQGEKGSITDWVKPGDKSGEFKRGQSVFRNFIENKPGAQFPPEKDRYHLYVSYACPWGMLKWLLC